MHKKCKAKPFDKEKMDRKLEVDVREVRDVNWGDDH